MAEQNGKHIRAWYERLTLFRAVRTIVAIATVLTLTAGTLARALEPETFTSIGLAFWWAVTTVSTVGYGDVVPTTAEGRVIGSLLMLTGLGLIPVVTSVAVSILTAKRARADYEEQSARLARIEERLERLGR